MGLALLSLVLIGSSQYPGTKYMKLDGEFLLQEGREVADFPGVAEMGWREECGLMSIGSFWGTNKGRREKSVRA